MNLWIRSQYGKLIKVHNIQPNFKSIICFDIAEGIVNLGNYISEERALEVLDEIQDVLMPKIKVLQSVNAEKNIDDLVFRPTIQECGKVELLQYSDYVYEMPKE